MMRTRRDPMQLSSNELHELKKIHSSGLRPFASDLRKILDQAHADDGAALLKAYLDGAGSLRGNEQFRYERAIKSGRRLRS